MLYSSMTKAYSQACKPAINIVNFQQLFVGWNILTGILKIAFFFVPPKKLKKDVNTLIIANGSRNTIWMIIYEFDQDPLRASDKTLTSCGPYKMKEDDAMVYRRPYLTSGSSGFALNAISRSMKKELKVTYSFMLSFVTKNITDCTAFDMHCPWDNNSIFLSSSKTFSWSFVVKKTWMPFSVSLKITLESLFMCRTMLKKWEKSLWMMIGKLKLRYAGDKETVG